MELQVLQGSLIFHLACPSIRPQELDPCCCAENFYQVDIMSRPPPAYLSQSDQRALREIRTRLWLGGIQGLAGGFLLGKIGYFFAEKLQKYHSLNMQPKHKFATPLVTAAIGGVTLSLTARRYAENERFKLLNKSERNEMHTLHYILAKSANPSLSEYQEAVAKGRASETGLTWEDIRKEKNNSIADLKEKEHEDSNFFDSKSYFGDETKQN